MMPIALLIAYRGYFLLFLHQKQMKLINKNKNFCGYALQNKPVVKLVVLLSNL